VSWDGHSDLSPLPIARSEIGLKRLTCLKLLRNGLRGHRGVNAALFTFQSYIRRQRTERRTGMRLRSLGDADVRVLSGRSKSLPRQRRADPAPF
jgi:hypothetical protein